MSAWFFLIIILQNNFIKAFHLWIKFTYASDFHPRFWITARLLFTKAREEFEPFNNLQIKQEQAPSALEIVCPASQMTQ